MYKRNNGKNAETLKKGALIRLAKACGDFAIPEVDAALRRPACQKRSGKESEAALPGPVLTFGQ